MAPRPKTIAGKANTRKASARKAPPPESGSPEPEAKAAAKPKNASKTRTAKSAFPKAPVTIDTSAGTPKITTINLALQGGGAHGAFTWGVLDWMLEHTPVAIDGISGTSAGAMNAVALVSGFQ